MAKKLKDKIYENIVKQLRNAKEAQETQGKLRQLEFDRAQILGAMEVLAESYEEEFGQKLQQVINNDPSWGELLKQAEAEAAGQPARSIQPITEQLQKVEQPAKAEQPVDTGLPKLKRLNDNKKVAQQAIDPPVNRIRQPVEIVINDEDDAGPGKISDDDDDI